jgi:hypothetical protein
VYRIAAEIAEEVGMLLEHEDVATGASEQKSRHHSGWTTTDYDQILYGIAL